MAAQTLSVIVPIRNAEHYLAACLDSLVAQARPIDEILLIDDHSTDESAAILERYARTHSQMKVLNGPRRGAAGARNAGLEHATGDWLAFVDADDWVEPDLYARLLSMAQRYDLDMALCNARYHFEGREPDRPVFTVEAPTGPLPGKDWFAQMLGSREFLHAVWMHLYRRSFIEEHHLRFTEGLMHEDVTWTTRALVLARRVAYDAAPLYVYRRQLRQFTRAALDERLQRIIETAITDARMLEEIANASDDARLARAIRWQLVDGGLSVFHKIRQLSTAELRRAQSSKVLNEKFFNLLWRNAADMGQKRRIASRFVRALAVRAYA